MEERDTQIQHEDDLDVNVDPSLDVGQEYTTNGDATQFGTSRDTATQDSTDDGFLQERLGFSTSAFLIAVILSVLGLIAGGAIPLIGIIGELVGIAGGAFLVGVATDTRRYLECALAGALVGGTSVLLSYFLFALLATGMTMLGIGLLGGAVAGTFGHYFGRDLRDGLTKDIDSSKENGY